MTPDLDKNNTLLSQVLEVLFEEGFSGMAQVFSVLFDEAMKRECSEALKALPYERTEERQGYANGYKPKTIETRVGAVTVEIPQVRGMSFYPRSLKRGVSFRTSPKASGGRDVCARGIYAKGERNHRTIMWS